MTIESPAFSSGGPIPLRFTCLGDNRSPPLIFRDVPKGTRSFTLLMDQQHTDRDVLVRWVVFNIDPAMRRLEEGESVPRGAASGANHWGETGYHGPQSEGDHVYTFRLFALDCRLN